MAQRVCDIQPFLAMEILERAQEFEREGRSIIHLEVGEPDFDTPDVITDAGIDALRKGDTHYTHSLGIRGLREAIALRYQQHYGVDVAPERVLITGGSSLALFYTFAALIEPGDEVLVGTPHYPCYPNFIRFFGGKMVEVPTDPQDGYRIDPAEIRKRITPSTKAVLLNSPANPTGAVLDAERLKGIAKLNVPILSDEIYHELVYEGTAPSALQFAPDAFVLDGFSKRYAMTGWRLGYLVVPTGQMRPFQKMQQNFMISANPFVQRAGVAALELGEPAVQAMRNIYDRRRKLTVELFRGLGFGIPAMPQGAFYVFADAAAFTSDSYAFAFELLEKTGVGVGPGIDFGSVGRASIRISYASSEENIKEAGRRIAEYLNIRKR